VQAKVQYETAAHQDGSMNKKTKYKLADIFQFCLPVVKTGISSADSG